MSYIEIGRAILKILKSTLVRNGYGCVRNIEYPAHRRRWLGREVQALDEGLDALPIGIAIGNWCARERARPQLDGAAQIDSDSEISCRLERAQSEPNSPGRRQATADQRLRRA